MLPGNEIRHSVVNGAGEIAHILGSLQTGSPVTRQVDVSRYLKRITGTKATFMIAQTPRWDVDINVTAIPASHSELTVGDAQPDALRVMLASSSGSTSEGPVLKLVFREPVRVSYPDWIEQYYPPESTLAAPDANPSGDGLKNLVKFIMGLDPRVAAQEPLPSLTVQDNLLTFRFPFNPLAIGVNLALEFSHDLSNWSPASFQHSRSGNSKELQVPIQGQSAQFSDAGYQEL
ncbi:MAG: hypothetical protein LR015_13705 [Verrucomicrobia bacterium]|nr:hypothetical protein [Verrucomicrobiota bacterium]